MNFSLFHRVVFVFLIAVSVPAFSQNPTMAKTPAWVKPNLPDLKAKSEDASSTGGFYYLLLDEQEHIAKQEMFRHYSYKLLTSDGVEKLSDISVTYDPSYQKLIFHKVVIHREGKELSQLSLGAIKNIQREENMDRNMYDDAVTSIIHLSDVRVGDVVEYSYTLKGYNSVFSGHYSQKVYFDYAVPIETSFNRIIVPRNSNLMFEYRNGEVKPSVATTSEGTEHVWLLSRGKAIIADNNQPEWYDPFRHVMITDFKNWREVSTWAIKHFEVSEAAKRQLASRIKDKFKETDPDLKLMEIIRFVQDEVRYLGFEGGLNSHKPHEPSKVFDQLYGDCKDKSLLLSSILQLNGFDSHPVLVNSMLRKRISDYVPTYSAFNHCITQVVHDGQTFYIDPTINYQGGRTIKENYLPNYGKGLVIRKESSDLIDLALPGEAEVEELHVFDLNTIGGEAFLTITTTYKGVEADIVRRQIAGTSLDEIKKFYLNYYGNLYPDILEEEPLSFTDDRSQNTLIVYEKYRIPTFWKPQEDSPNKIFCEIYPLGVEQLVNVEKSATRKSPYRLNFPVSYRHRTQVRLPEEWNIEPTDELIRSAYYHYQYTTSYENREINVYHHYKTLDDEVPVNALAKFTEDHQAMMNNLSYNLTYDKSVQNLSGVSWFAVIFSLGVLAVGLFLAYRLFIYDPKPSLDGSEGEEIGGWLFLVAIGIIFSPFRLLWDFLVANEFYENQTWTGLYLLKNWPMLALLTFELISNILLIIFSVLLMALFFKRRSSLPRMITIYYISLVSIQVIDIAAVNLLSDDDVSYQPLIQALIVASIWIPYFNLSQRVNETFVERLHDDQDVAQNPAEAIQPETVINENQSS
jgi:transglutaminase-like putative cysteine protease